MNADAALEDLVIVYFFLLDEKRAHKARCPWPGEKKLKEIEQALCTRMDKYSDEQRRSILDKNSSRE